MCVSVSVRPHSWPLSPQHSRPQGSGEELTLIGEGKNEPGTLVHKVTGASMPRQGGLRGPRPASEVGGHLSTEFWHAVGRLFLSKVNILALMCQLRFPFSHENLRREKAVFYWVPTGLEK